MTRKSSSLAELSQPGAAEPEVRIGTGIRHARITLGIRLQDVAARVGCSESLISKIENGRTLPSLTTLHRIADALQTTVGRLCATADPNDGVVAHCRATSTSSNLATAVRAPSRMKARRSASSLRASSNSRSAARHLCCRRKTRSAPASRTAIAILAPRMPMSSSSTRRPASEPCGRLKTPARPCCTGSVRFRARKCGLAFGRASTSRMRLPEWPALP